MAARYPILLDVDQRLCVIVGGGAVAARKAATLLDCGARRVRVVAPELRGTFDPRVEHVNDRYGADHLDGATLVFACTDSPVVNEQVVRDAHARGILVNRTDTTSGGAGDDEATAGDFTVPARLREGNITVTVSAGSAALAAAVRDGLKRGWDPGWTAMADAMSILRPKFLADSRLDPPARRAIFRDLASEEAIAIARDGGLAAIESWLATRHAPLRGDNPVRE
jgi:siroheme synthase-like protein